MVRSRLAALLRAAVRMQRLAALTGIAELVAARPAAAGGWEMAVVRHGRLAAAARRRRACIRGRTLDMLLATAETVAGGPGPMPCATAEETERILAWLERPETRLVEASAGWASPVRGAARFRDLLRRAEAAAGAETRPIAHEQLTDRPTRSLITLLRKYSPDGLVRLVSDGARRLGD